LLNYACIGRVVVQFHAFLTWALDGGEWLGSHPCLFTPRERPPGTHWTGGWVGPTAGLDVVVRKRTHFLPGIEPRSFSP